MDALKDVTVGSRIFRLPGVGLRLSYRGIAIVRQSTGGVRRCIITLTGVGEVTADADLQFQLRDDSPLGKGCADDTTVLRLSLRILQVADGVTHPAVVNIDAGGSGIIIIRAVGIIYRGVRRMGDGAEPGTGSKHATTVVRYASHLVQGSIGIDSHQQVLEDIALVIDAAGIACKACAFDDTILILVTAADAIARYLITAYGRNLVFLLEACAQGLALPVITLSGIGKVVTQFSVLIQFMPDVCPLLGVQEVQFPGDATPSERGVITDVVFAVRALLGGDDDHTVGTTGTIDGCGRHVLQHLDALDVRGIQERQRVEGGVARFGTSACRCRIVIHDESVDHIEWFVTAGDGVSTTDADDAGSTRLTRGLGDIQTCDGSLKGTLHGGVLLLQQLIAYGGDAAGEFQTFLGTIAYHDHLIQFAGVIDQLNLHRLLEVVDIHVEGTIAYIFHSQGQRGFHLGL